MAPLQPKAATGRRLGDGNGTRHMGAAGHGPARRNSGGGWRCGQGVYRLQPRYRGFESVEAARHQHEQQGKHRSFPLGSGWQAERGARLPTFDYSVGGTGWQCQQPLCFIASITSAPFLLPVWAAGHRQLAATRGAGWSYTRDYFAFVRDLPLPANCIIRNHEASSEKPAVRWLTVDEESAGQRLDNYLLRRLKGVPKTHVYRIIRSGEVRLNQGRAAADSRVAAGDQVRVPPLRMRASAETQTPPAAPAREFPILFEDEHLLAIDKPAGVAVHGGSGVSFGVIEQLRQARPTARFLELVHRLDRETSGVLLIAKKPAALKDVQRQLRQRQVGKTYLALALGAWPGNLKVIDAPLARYLIANGQGEGERRVRITAQDDPAGQRAVTLVQVLERLPEATLLAVTIKTGRTHQIRVHLSSRGHPIAGDDKYGDFAHNKALQKRGLKRMALHAWQLRLTHPASGQPLALMAPLPPELRPFCGAWHGDADDAREPLFRQ